MKGRSIDATAPGIAIAGTVTAVTLVAALHVLEPEIEPSWRFISEYAIGAYGWMMTIAFLCFAAAYLALYATVRPMLDGASGRIGAGALIISAVGLLVAGLFQADPVTTLSADATLTGRIHAVGGALGMAMPFAVGFVSWRLLRDARWVSARGPIASAAVVAIAGFAYAFAATAMALVESGGRFGPGVNVGWPNRIETSLYAVWVVMVAWQARSSRKHH